MRLVILLISLSTLNAQYFPPGGGGSSGGSGTVTSIATGCGTSGGTITTSGTIIATEPVNSQTGTSYTLLNGDCGKLVTHSNGSATADTVPQANGSTFVAGWFVDIQNVGAGTVTITPTTSTVDGAATLVLTTGQGARIVSNGTNYFSVRANLSNYAPLASPAFTGNPTAPTQSQGDASTKVSTTSYVDTAIANAVAGVNPAIAVLAASTANVAGTYTHVAGIGDFFTVTATGAFTLDGIAINTIGQRVLLKNQSSGLQNGMYTATVVGAVAVSPVFTRALDYDTPSDINSTGAIPVQSGTVNTTTSWLLTSTVAAVGTDALTYVQFSIAPGTPTTVLTNLDYNVGACTTAATIAAANGNRQKVTLTNAQTCALTFTQPVSGTISINLKVIQSSAGSFNGLISGGKWPGGVAPTITATSAAVDILSCYLDGANTYCAASQDFR